jgi:hypothetical protein
MAGMGTFAKKMQSRERGNSFDYTAAESDCNAGSVFAPRALLLDRPETMGQGGVLEKNGFWFFFGFFLFIWSFQFLNSVWWLPLRSLSLRRRWQALSLRKRMILSVSSSSSQ